VSDFSKTVREFNGGTKKKSTAGRVRVAGHMDTRTQRRHLATKEFYGKTKVAVNRVGGRGSFEGVGGQNLAP